MIHQLPEDGGAPQPLTRFENGETQHVWPEFLPGSKALLLPPSPSIRCLLLLFNRSAPVNGGTCRARADHAALRVLRTPGVAQRGNLMAVPFDLGRLEVKGAAVAVEVVRGVSQSGAATQYSLSTTGSLAYVPGSLKPDEYRLVWVSRNGAEQTLSAPRASTISHESRRMASELSWTSWRGRTSRCGECDLARDGSPPFTYKADGVNRHGVWQPDSTRVVFMSSREGKGQTQLYRQSVDGAGLEQLTTFPPAQTADILPIPYSLCGSELTFVKLAATPELWVQRTGDPPPDSGQGRMPRRLSVQSSVDGGPQLSPDCRWWLLRQTNLGGGDFRPGPIPVWRTNIRSRWKAAVSRSGTPTAGSVSCSIAQATR